MNEDTNEFSIILLLDHDSTAKINKVRERVPVSPVRVDPPHLTLLRGISSAEYKTDGELITLVQNFLNSYDVLSEIISVNMIHNHTGRLYGTSSNVEVNTSATLKHLRENLIKLLVSNDFRIESVETQSFRPHLSIALSSPLEPGQKFDDILPLGSQLGFSGFGILRLQQAHSDGKRRMRQIP